MSLVPVQRPTLAPLRRTPTVTPDLGLVAEPFAPRRPARTGADPAVREYTPRLALRGISGHLAHATTGTTAWYAVAPRAWSMRPDDERDALMGALAGALARLQGRWLHWRVTWRPHAAAEWARRHDAWARPLPDVPGAVSWDAHLVGEQRRALTSPKAVKEVLLGVEVRGPRGRLGALGDALARRLGGARAADRRVDGELGADVRDIDAVLASSALGAAPLPAARMLHLLYRSCALGLPAQSVLPAAPHGEWEREDVAAVDGLARWSADPYAPTVAVTGVVDGALVTRHVVVASMGRMGDIDVPGEDLPWMTVPDDLPVPVEWSARMRVLPRDRAARGLRQAADRVEAQRRHYEADHGRQVPSALVRGLEAAEQVRGDLETDSPLALRCEGWWRMAIPGRTEREALELFDEVRRRYAPKIAVERSEAQYRLAREFVPGEPLATTAFRRRMSLRHVATAVPQATDLIGDDHGPLLLRARTSGRLLAWDPWHDAGAGPTPVVGGPGAGKTFLLGAVAAQLVRSCGAFVTLLDPSGALGRLVDVPELGGHTRRLSLRDAPPGVLNPFTLVDDPPEPAATAEDAWRHAAGRRAALVVAVLAELLPAAVRSGAQVRPLLVQAVERVGHDRAHDAGEVVDALQHMGAEGERLAAALAPALAAAGALSGRCDQPWSATADRLLVVSTTGLAESGADDPVTSTLVRLAAWLVRQRVHVREGSAPTLVGIDDVHRFTATPAGRTLVTGLVRDGRTRTVVTARQASDLLSLVPDDGDAIPWHDAFVGRTEPGNRADALRLLGVAPHEAHQLPGPADAPGEFRWRSGPHCEPVRVDVSGPHLAGLRAALGGGPR
ncbi:ATP-binding protein [Pseudonocardia benzenivorans]|uniref:hypothetical protein n=1 Tax=Pseudonocardia benzenivorans TaxID=228005 RepID=UPI00338D15AF